MQAIEARRQFWGPILVILVIFVTAWLWGCAPARSTKPFAVPSEITAPTLLWAGLDTSASNRPRLVGEVQFLVELAVQLDANRDWVTVVRVDANLREIYSYLAPQRSSDFVSEIVPKLKPLSGSDGTQEDLFWTEAARRAKAAHGPVVILFASDGFAEGATQEGAHRIREAATAIAQNPHVIGVFVVGLDPANELRVRSSLAPLLTARKLVTADVDRRLETTVLAALKGGNR